MFNRWIEDGLLGVLREEGIGCIVFSPLAQGLLTDRYLSGIPVDSRAAKPHGFLRREEVTAATLTKVRRLSDVARARGQSLAQMALAWVLRHGAHRGQPRRADRGRRPCPREPAFHERGAAGHREGPRLIGDHLAG
jgi:aryl-alcohol dehydrogenase-like predicted oxidoreductase